jgi:hypothetical protein
MRSTTVPHSDAERWKAKPLSTLQGSSAKMPWLWHGYIARSSITLFTGLWKAGKTTVVCNLLNAFAEGGPGEFAGLPVAPSRILIITEESERDWMLRRDALGLGDHVAIISRPFVGRPYRPAWEGLIANVAAQVTTDAYDLVIIDSLPNLWPVQDENDAGQVITALSPLYGITKANAGVVLVAHPRKGDAGEGQAMRGSGATAAFADVIVEMRRYDPERRADNRRTLTAYSRYDDTPVELVLDFDHATGYRAVGTKVEASAADRLAVIRSILHSGPPGLTAAEIYAAWPEGSVAKPGERTIKLDLEHAIELDATSIARTGKGVRGDAHRYHLANSIPASSTSQDRNAPESTSNAIPPNSTSPGGSGVSRELASASKEQAWTR